MRQSELIIASKSAIIWYEYDGRGKESPVFTLKSWEGLFVKIHKVREQVGGAGKPYASPVVNLKFSGEHLHIRLVNCALSRFPHHKPVFDPYTNRYAEWPATFVLLPSVLKDGQYEISQSSDYRGDFLLLKSSEQTLVINLWAVFMFQNLTLHGDGKFLYHNVKAASVVLKRGEIFPPFLLIVPEGKKNSEEELIEKFKLSSFSLVYKWLPFMSRINACEEIHTDTRESRFDTRAAKKYMRDHLEKLIFGYETWDM